MLTLVIFSELLSFMQINMKKKDVKQAGSPIFIREIQDFNLDMLTLDPE